MKRFVSIAFISILSWFCIQSKAQTVPDTFFGIKLGERITKEIIASKVGKTVVGEDNRDSYVSSYEIHDVKFNGKHWNIVYFLSNYHGQLTGVYFHRFTNYDLDTPYEILVKDSNYISLIESLGPVEQLVSDPNGENPTLVSLDDKTARYTVSVKFENMENDNGKQVKAMSLTYLNTHLLMKATMDMNLPAIQDTFFGIKLGSRPTISQIKIAVGSKGRYLRTDNPESPAYTFCDVYYAGKRWDYAEFAITPNGQFYQFRAYDTYPDNSWNTDEKQMANSTFQNLKSRLDSKYGYVDAKSDNDGIHVIYFGKRNICTQLSNERSESQGGEYRRYVTIAYADYTLMEEVIKSMNNEL